MPTIDSDISEETLPQHVHFGAGSFGLGMVVEICHGQAGLRTVVVNRESEKDHHKLLKANGSYAVELDGDRDRHTTLKPEFLYYTEQDKERLLNLLASPSLLLITTAVRKENLSLITPLLSEGLARRHKAVPSSAKLCVMACENLSGNSAELQKLVELRLSAEQRQHLRKEVFFCNTLVDRVCAQISCSNGGVRIPIETFQSWIVESPNEEIPSLSLLEKNDLITLAHSRTEFKAYEVQKYWLMNGVHLATAAYAYNYNKDLRYIAQALAVPVIAEKIKALQDELAVAFLLYISGIGLQWLFPEERVGRYNVKVFQRLQRARADTIGRILKFDHKSPDAIMEILDRIERLVGPQCEIQAKRKGLVHPANESVALHPPPKRVNERLELDDAVQQVVLAMRAFALDYREELVS